MDAYVEPPAGLRPRNFLPGDGELVALDNVEQGEGKVAPCI
jgi:hypothetical protein